MTELRCTLMCHVRRAVESIPVLRELAARYRMKSLHRNGSKFDSYYVLGKAMGPQVCFAYIILLIFLMIL